ncbi:MAG TPA: murein L,D-transpeptidase [Rhodobacteraceae bacterium]|nr:murein L,D-transpeptidase [Paracoccaceae bacterium]
MHFPCLFRVPTSRCLIGGLAVCALALSLAGAPAPATAQVTAYKQAVAEAAWEDDDIAAFYRETGYAPIWTGEDDDARARRAALLRALEGVEVHGLPAGRYDPEGLLRRMGEARTTRDLGLLEVELSRAFLRYARDVQSGMLIPARIDDGIKREVNAKDRQTQLVAFAQASDPVRFMRQLPPATGEYRALMKQKLKMERLIAEGGWGAAVPMRKLEPGDSGAAVVALRDRLIRMGYMERSATMSYDRALEAAVLRFQLAHGLEADGVAGTSTLEEINVSAADRLKSVIVAMERERWLNLDRGERHILVNQTDFSAKIIDNGRVRFQTRAVIGKNLSTHETPEFSDVMDHMVINPSWYVPRSIIASEYLPQLRANPYAVSHLVITDARGRQVNRGAVNFARYSARNFPFDMRQPPGPRNALGRVKFMFPNKHNIYLHDTPHKNLFSREVRTYSHGCIRLNDPFDFAYALLSYQEERPQAFFDRVLASGQETRVELKEPLPVHLIYRTAFTTTDGRTEYRRDVYDRDARIWEALRARGVALPSYQG